MTNISVLLSVYNDQDFIKASIQSIINSSFQNFELIVINDGSKDNTLQIIKNFKDRRIKIFSKENTGLIDSLNYGLKKCTSNLIMRMDGDDEIKPNKISVQLELFKQSNSVLMGTGAFIINNQSEILTKISVPEKHDEIVNCKNNLKTSFIHPSVMFKKDIVIKAGGYDPKFEIAEDYDLFYRMSRLGKISNINQPLMLLRKNDQNISVLRSSTQLLNTIVARKIYKNDQNIIKVTDDIYNSNKLKVKSSFLYYIINIATIKINQNTNLILKFYYKFIRRVALILMSTFN